MIHCDSCERDLTSSDLYIVRDKKVTTVKCGHCRSEIDSYGGETGQNAQRFEPIVLWVNNEDPTKVSVPGRADEPVQEGYHAVEIRTLPEADRWTKTLDEIEIGKAQINREHEKQYWDQVTKERREDIRAKIGSNPRAQAMLKKVAAYVDAKRERRYSKTMDPRGHFKVVAYDSSNREGHSDERTGWKEKKG